MEKSRKTEFYVRIIFLMIIDATMKKQKDLSSICIMMLFERRRNKIKDVRFITSLQQCRDKYVFILQHFDVV